MNGGRALVAGTGNIFLSDDGFGVAVAQRLGAGTIAEGVEVLDVGIRGVHLAYRLLDGYELLILVDTVARDGPPGTVYVIEPERGIGPETRPEQALGLDGPPVDAHGMTPDAVLALVESLGGSVGRVVVVGCAPATLEEGIGLSDPVAAAVPTAAEVVRRLLADAGYELDRFVLGEPKGGLI
jgi:hydrogenase maturation protease